MEQINRVLGQDENVTSGEVNELECVRARQRLAPGFGTAGRGSWFATAMPPTPPRGEDIRFARKALGLQQEQLAFILGCAGETISRWETGALEAPAMLRWALAGLLERKVRT